MSMPTISTPNNPIDREQAINDLIESVALIETGLSHVVNAEGEKIQKVVSADGTVDDMIKINDSASKMINTISKLEMMLQNKLSTTNDLRNNNIMSLNNEIIIPYSGNYIYLTTAEDGGPYEGVPLGFSGYTNANILMDGNVDVLNLDDYKSVIERTSFSMPKDGIITGFSAFYTSEDYDVPQTEMQVTARIYKAKRGSNIYYATDAMLNLEPKLPASSDKSVVTDGIKSNLNVELKSMDKVLLIFYLTHSNEIKGSNYCSGSGGGSILIQTTK